MQKVLITYATKYGSTAEVAKIIGDTLRAEGATVDVLPAKDVKDIGGYGAVVVGSGVYMGKWLSDATTFVKENQQELKKVPVAYFVVCMTMKDDNEKNRATAASCLNAPGALVKPVATGLFAGAIDYSRLGFLDRMAAKMVKAPQGDFRNRDAIKAWAKAVYPRLKALALQ